MNRMSPFVRNLLILALVALLIVVLNLGVALSTVALLVRFAFVVAIAVVAYFVWRDVVRHEASLWPARSQWVFYGAVGLFVVDAGWWMLDALTGPDALAAILVAVACIYAAVRTWLERTSTL
jgi:hypothetical protein